MTLTTLKTKLNDGFTEIYQLIQEGNVVEAQAKFEALAQEIKEEW